MAALNLSVNLGFFIPTTSPGGGGGAKGWGQPSLFSEGTGALSREKLLVLGVEHAPPSNVKFKKV
jgi:hypothetical protein